VRLRKLAIDGEKTLQGVAELAYHQSFEVQCIQRLSTALTGPPEPISRSSARRSRTDYRRDAACREPSSWYTKRATSARCGAVTQGVLRPCRGRDPPLGIATDNVPIG
jgi:hypothetical protein